VSMIRGVRQTSVQVGHDAPRVRHRPSVTCGSRE
jgi:hypothetical protein